MLTYRGGQCVVVFVVLCRVMIVMIVNMSYFLVASCVVLCFVVMFVVMFVVIFLCHCDVIVMSLRQVLVVALL